MCVMVQWCCPPQPEAVGAERESSVRPAHGADGCEGDAPAGPGGEADAGGREEPTDGGPWQGGRTDCVPP